MGVLASFPAAKRMGWTRMLVASNNLELAMLRRAEPTVQEVS